MNKDKQTFPAIFTYATGKDNKVDISIEFPNLEGCFSCASNMKDAFKNAKDVLGLWLWSMENDGENIPEPSIAKDIKLETDQQVAFVGVYLSVVRNKLNNRTAKKTLTLPFWLNKMGIEAGVNFSQVLQKALKEELDVTEPPKKAEEMSPLENLKSRMKRDYRKDILNNKRCQSDIRYYADEIMLNIDEMDILYSELHIDLLLKQENPLSFLIRILQDKPVLEIIWEELNK